MILATNVSAAAQLAQSGHLVDAQLADFGRKLAACQKTMEFCKVVYGHGYVNVFAVAAVHTGNALPCCRIDYHMAQVDVKSDLLLQRHRLKSEASWLSNPEPALFLTW